MKLQLIKTKETDGDWYKILVDDRVKAVVNAKNDKSLDRAFEIYEFITENKGEFQIIKEEEV